MDISRRKFVKIGSIVPFVYVFPFSKNILKASDSITAPAISLYKAFQDPSAQARPFVRWWWNGDRVVEQELLRELDMLKEKGVSGVEINTIAFPEKNNPLNYKANDWLSDEWMNMLKVTLKGAKERGITCDIIVGSGWPFGGEFLKRDEQIQLLALGSKNLVGGQQYKIQKKELLQDMDALMTYKSGVMELTGLTLAPAAMQTFTPGINLKGEMTKDEILVDVPAGDHVLYYLVKLTGYTAVTHGAPGASGPVLNHYNGAAVQRYLDRMSDAITAKIGPMGNYFRSVFVDSLELRGSNWCDDMLAEFKRRRGYDLEPYLPFVMFKINKKSTYNGGLVIEENNLLSAPVKDEIDRVRYDFETTRLELFHERFLQTFVNWCKKNGVKSRVQAYGREYYPLEASMILDIPECETWLHADVGNDMKEKSFSYGRAYRPVNKFASSAARLTGKHIVSAEEITNTAMVFNDTLERIKITGDQSNLSGVTHSILHGFNYSPKDVPFPGWVRYGSFFNERNTWWPYLKTWIDYKARLSQVFQQGTLQSDVAVMFADADMWSKFGLQYQQYPQLIYPDYADNIWETIHQNGSGCDYINERILQQSTFSGGMLHYNTRSYKALLMPEVESVAPETVDALRKFAAAGGLVVFIGKQPVKTYGKLDHAAKDEKVAAAVKSLMHTYPKNAVLFKAPGETTMLDWYAQMQSSLNISPFVKFDKPAMHVSQVHYKTADADVFFISNYHLTKPHQFTATFNIKNRTAWLWDPETGKKFVYPYDGVKNKLKITLDPTESKLIVFTGETAGEVFAIRKPFAVARPIEGPWNVTLEKVYEQPRKTTFDKLIDFKEDKDLQSFGGVVYYEKSFKADTIQGYNYLDLGKVAGISEVQLNGHPLGFKWYGKHLYDLKGALKAGDNVLKIKITTVLGNYAKSLKDNEVTQQWTKAQPLYSMGLIGPIAIV